MFVLLFEDLTKAFGLEGRSYCPVGKIFNGVHVIVMDDKFNLKAIGDPGEVNMKLYTSSPTKLAHQLKIRRSMSEGQH